ncbi:hypothetical protein [Actinacidiphila guanduensis]|uniref:hypothetical protein n=1 Tax=Actinacidiphila guanduensis TaxID=310781 RepID=UPI00159F7AD2|nr:hypothetical protein [Actinacidiphila guanduensis]
MNRYDTTNTRLMCFSGAGFNDKAHAAAADPAVRLIDLATLYGQVSMTAGGGRPVP